MSSKQATPARPRRATRKPPAESKPRRKRVPGDDNQSIYLRYDGQYEVGYRDSNGKQRWAGPHETIASARAERDTIRGDKARGKRIEPNPNLRFGQALDRWLAEQVPDLRPRTRDIYTGHAENHLRARWGNRRMDRLDVDEAAKLAPELRAKGLSEWTIAGILNVANRVFKFAQRRMRWSGQNPIALLERGERAKVGATAKRRIYQRDELAQTLAAASGRWQLLFTLAIVSAARLSELLGLVWENLDLEDVDDATISFTHQVDRHGNRVPLKTTESDGVVALPRAIAVALKEHKATSEFPAADDFVFCTATGHALGQRNVLRALRSAQKRARTADGKKTFAVLHRDGPIPRGSVPTFHAFRHTAATYAIASGDTAEDVGWLLRHKDSTVTRRVYIHELKDAERLKRSRAKLEARFGATIAPALADTAPVA